MMEDHLLAAHRAVVSAASPLVANDLDEVEFEVGGVGKGDGVHFTVHALDRKFLVSIKVSGRLRDICSIYRLLCGGNENRARRFPIGTRFDVDFIKRIRVLGLSSSNRS